MQIEQKFDLPFDSEFDWRVSLVCAFSELARDCAVDVLQNIDTDDYNIHWGDMSDELIKHAVRENLFPALIKAMEIKAKKYTNQ